MTTKQMPITAFPLSDSTNESWTFGTINVYRTFDTSSTYEIGELVKDANGNKMRFIKHHNPGNLSSDEYVTVSDETSSVKADISFISESMERIEDELRENGGNYAFSLCNLEKYKDYSIRVSAYGNPSFDRSGILVYAESTDGKSKLRGRTDSSGMCVLKFLRDKDYLVWTEEKDGYRSASNSGEKHVLTAKALNFYELPPQNFVSGWNYHVGERVSYDSEAYSFTAEYSGAWNPSKVQPIDIRENVIDFVYTRANTDGDVNLKVSVEHRGGIPYANFGPISVFSDDDMSEWRSGSADASGNFECTFPKNTGCHITSVTANWSADFNLPEPVVTVTDRDKEVTLTYDSGLYWVCGETSASLLDGTANKEFLLEDFPFDDPNDSEAWVTSSYKIGSTTYTTKHPTKHPCYLLHVATPELVSRKFDHSTDMPALCSGNPLVSTCSDQVFPQWKQKYDASYYVRIQDLSYERTSEVTQGRQWCSQNLLHEHVTTARSPSVLSSYDGPLMTSWCKYDSENRLTNDGGTTFVAASSQAANYALSSEFQLGDRTLHGFIGTYMQMNPLFMLSDAIYSGMEKFGYVGNYKTGTYYLSVTQYGPTTIEAYRENGKWSYEARSWTMKKSTINLLLLIK